MPLSAVWRRLQHVQPLVPGPHEVEVGQLERQPLGAAAPQLRVHHLHADREDDDAISSDATRIRDLLIAAATHHSRPSAASIPRPNVGRTSLSNLRA